MFENIKTFILGKPKNPLQKDTRKHISLIAFFAWVGLGADGLSSLSYGPQEAFLALKDHPYLSIYLLFMISITIFIISMAYKQVIELFPSGGGSYKVATRLIGKFAGLICGTSLLLGYILTISMSIASGVDCLFSLFPLEFQQYKFLTGILTIFLLVYLNLRGIKESIKVFLPVFLSFIITHVFIILYGIFLKCPEAMNSINYASYEITKTSETCGGFFLIALLLQAYSLGSGTYTGLEAISNNVNMLAEPKVQTGKWAMLYMAISLSFLASGIIFMYYLYNVVPVTGETLNATTFSLILKYSSIKSFFLPFILLTETGLLFIGANTGFIGGSSVLANMSIDSWLPKKFQHLSSRLVVQNGIILFGVCAILVLFFTKGSISKLLVVYSTSVFITFTVSLLGLSFYWLKNIKIDTARRIFKFSLSFLGFLICLFILFMLIYTKFMSGGWLAIAINVFVAFVCLIIWTHYKKAKKEMKKLDTLFIDPDSMPNKVNNIENLSINFDLPTAAFFVGNNLGESMHTILWAQRLFVNYFKNFVFLSAGIVDVYSFESDKAIEEMKKKVETRLGYLINYSNSKKIPSMVLCEYGTDHIEKLVDLSEKIKEKFKTVVFFASRVILKNENWITRQLHNETPLALQRNLHMRGMKMIILPVILDLKRK